MDEFDIPEFVERCIQGDDRAHAEFYNRYSPFLRNAVRNRLHQLNVYYSQDDVEDLTNEVILKISEGSYTRMRSLNQPASLNGWLFVIARNHTTTFVRSQARRDTILREYAQEVIEENTPKSQAVVERLEDRERIQESLKSLDGRERLVVTMYYIDGLKYFEIAEALSININTVATLIRRAKQKLRKYLST